MELQIAAQTRDDALSKAEAIEQELNSLKDYLALVLSSSANIT